MSLAPIGLEAVVALASALLPDRAARIVMRLAPPSADQAAARVAQLSALPRPDRVAALAAGLEPALGPAPRTTGGRRPTMFHRLCSDALALVTSGTARDGGTAPGGRGSAQRRTVTGGRA